MSAPRVNVAMYIFLVHSGVSRCRKTFVHGVRQQFHLIFALRMPGNDSLEDVNAIVGRRIVHENEFDSRLHRLGQQRFRTTFYVLPDIINRNYD